MRSSMYQIQRFTLDQIRWFQEVIESGEALQSNTLSLIQIFGSITRDHEMKPNIFF